MYRVYRYRFKDGATCDKHVFINRDRSLKVKSITEKYNKKRLAVNISRVKKTVNELAYCNKFDYFCTFTFAADKANRYDMADCRKKISALFNHYKTRYSPDFKYLLIPEYHKDGAIHMHGLIAGIRDLDLIVPLTIPKLNIFTGIVEQVPNTPHYKDWPYYSKKFGYFSCSEIKNRVAVSRYILKYITKDLVQLPRAQQCYMCSKGLDRAELIFDCDDVPMSGAPVW
jgi:hypothetical protein